MPSNTASTTSYGVKPATALRQRGKNLQDRIREQILLKLMAADVKVGDRYGTESELAKELGVSRNTLRKAMADLEARGVVSRRRGVGMILEKHPLAGTSPQPFQPPTKRAGRLAVIVQLPRWNDDIEGFYTGRLLEALASPELDPPLSLEVRHHNDPIQFEDVQGRTVIAVDPSPLVVPHLCELDRQGTPVLILDPCQEVPQLPVFATDVYKAIRESVIRFHELGHTYIGMINHRQKHLNFERSCVAYFDAHRELSKPTHPGGFLQVAGGREIEPADIDVHHITAWICTYLTSVDVVGVACQRAGLRIPDDVSILSKDETGDAPVASVGQRVSSLAISADAIARALHRCVADPTSIQRGTETLFPYQFNGRDSIAAPPAGR